jgi:putative acetyltransferase
MTSILAFDIRPREPHDDPAIAAVIASAFGANAEAELVEALRRDGDVVCEFVAVDEARAVAGHILFSRLVARAGSQSLRATALAPLSVRPDVQSKGMGQALTRAALEHCRNTGEELAVVLGHPDYYPRFGFSALQAKLLKAPYAGPSFMALELKPGVTANLVWQVAYPRAFSAT